MSHPTSDGTSHGPPGSGEQEVVDERGRPVRRTSGWGDWGGNRSRDFWTWGWAWPPGEGRRPGIPWIGVFLLLLGGLLLLEQLVPGAHLAGSTFLLALGLAFLVSWAIDRGPGTLYVGAILAALGLSSVLTETGVVNGPGWGTLFLGIAFALIALLRAANGGGLGWQAWGAAIFVVVGGGQIVQRQILGLPDLGRFLWPLILVALGVWLVFRARDRSAYH